MLPTFDQKSPSQLSWEQRLLKNASGPRGQLKPEYQELKFTLHRKLLLVHSDNALAHYHLGFAYGVTGHSRDEISEYLAAAKLGLSKWDLFLNLGLAYLGQNDWPKAINALQTAVLRGPNHPEAHFNLAIAYERGNRLREARQEIMVSLRLARFFFGLLRLDEPDSRSAKKPAATLTALATT